MSDAKTETSEWNQQQLFAEIFFNVTNSCRFHQSTRNARAWKNSLESKISLVLGICSKSEKIILVNIKNRLIEASIMANRSGDNTKLADMLFLAEADVDEITHKHMPFLKLGKKFDSGGF